MKNGFVALALALALALIASCLIMIFPAAMAKQEPPTEERSGEVVLPPQTESRPESGSKPAVPATGSRGQLLYENHCQLCHTSVVHVRETRRARSLKELEHWVTRWSGELNLSWGADEISDVVDYLNRRYYKLDIPSR